MKIQTKILILVSVCLIGVWTVGAFGLAYYDRQTARSAHENHAVALAWATVNLLEQGMTDADIHDIRDVITRAATVPEMAEVVFFDREGHFVASTAYEASYEEEVHRLDIERALRSGEVVLAWRAAPGRDYVGAFVPVKNKSICQSCHPPDVEVLGVLEVGLGVTALSGQLRRDLILMGGIIVVGVLATALLLGLAFSRLVSRRIGGLKQLAARIGEGDYSALSMEKGSDEIAGLAYSLEGMARRLSELEARRDEFIATASHELRTPMTGVMGLSELLLYRDVPEGTRREWLQRIYEESQRLTSIIDELLNISRIQSGRLSVESGPVSISRLVEETLEAHRSTSDRHQFYADLPPDLPPAWADRDRLNQVLINLLDNAVKYSPQGGPITVSARHEPQRQRVVVGVSDRGIGVASEDQERLFETFGRIQRPETTGIRGTGLGLYLVKSLLDLMHGEIWLESELNKGSTFYFALPTHDPEAPNRGGAR